MPAAFYNGMAASQIEVVTEVVLPSATSISDFTGLPPLDKEAARIKASGTNILINLLDPISIFYSLHEAMRCGVGVGTGPLHVIGMLEYSKSLLVLFPPLPSFHS